MKNNIVKLQNIYKDAVWGEDTLSFQLGITPRRISEVWSFINTDEQSITDSGEEVSNIMSRDEFPLVIKILNAAKDLSVQVHPRKNEAWYILSAKEGATLSLGFKNENFDIDGMGVPSREILDELQVYHPREGEVYYVPQGAVHYLGGGIRALEVQTDLLETFRVYDHDRLEDGKPRPLHISEAKTCLNPKEKGEIITDLVAHDKCVCNLLDTPYFTMKRLFVAQGDFQLETDNKKFCIICTKGTGAIERYDIKQYDTFLVLDCTDKLSIKDANNLELVLVYAK